ncbi:hypothetical protein P7C70_g2181, partial [Phenoliferia sp. Uapishka_3]
MNSIPASVSTPQELASLFRLGGGYDSLRRQLMADFLSSPDKATFDARLDSIIPIALSRPTPSTTTKQDRHHTIVADIQGRHTVLNRVVAEVERGIRAKERERESKGGMGELGAMLDATLRRSRGEVVQTLSGLLPLLAGEERSLGEALRIVAAEADNTTTATDLAPPTPEKSPLTIVPPLEIGGEAVAEVVKEEETIEDSASLEVEVKAEASDVEMAIAT